MIATKKSLRSSFFCRFLFIIDINKQVAYSSQKIEESFNG